MYNVYVIKSNSHDRIYIGSSENVEERILQHNAGKTPSTKSYRPWNLIYTEAFTTRREAIIRERQIKKSGLIRKAIKAGTYQAPSSIG
ncbi:MAG: GIY-YIG nuclease family protein [Parcubacteria group bacterium]|nr:GIY-YIG nuclease family protein [Parcubacteria group bacterium]